MEEEAFVTDRIKVVEEAIISRRSVRAFLQKPVPLDVTMRILDVAARAPSGTNMQPWQVVLLRGSALQEFCDHVEGLAREGHPGAAPYAYYPEVFPEPYLSRRRKVGLDLYGLLGIGKGESDKMARQHARNFRFFNAPVGLIFLIDRALELGSFLDYGMYLQNVMTLARAHGLDTCPQAAFIKYNGEILRYLEIPATKSVICGMALGFADNAAPENRLLTERARVDEFVEVRE